MNIDILSTPPSHKSSIHHGMADRKPLQLNPYPLSNLKGCIRKLFLSDLIPTY